MATPRFDHAVLFVDDLDEAIAAYSNLGFNVVPGGTHAGGLTSNALVPFGDGTYLELLAFNIPDAFVAGAKDEPTGHTRWTARGRTALDRRFLPRARLGVGLRDFAIAVPSVEAAIGSSGRAGLQVDGPYPGSRARADGTRVAWKLGMPKGGDLPFLIEDITDRSLRVPGGVATNHPNGVVGIEGILVGVRDLAASLTRYRRLLGKQLGANHDAALLTLHRTTIELAEGPSPGPHTIRLASSSDSNLGLLDEAACCGGRIEVRPAVC